MFLLKRSQSLAVEGLELPILWLKDQSLLDGFQRSLIVLPGVVPSRGGLQFFHSLPAIHSFGSGLMQAPGFRVVGLQFETLIADFDSSSVVSDFELLAGLFDPASECLLPLHG